MACRRPSPSWSRPPQHAWSLDEIKHGNILSTHSLNNVIQTQCVTFGRIADDPAIVDIVTAHESCSRLHARIAFDQNGTPWLRDLGSGNGTFVNEKMLPPEACGKGEEESNTNSNNRKGSRGVVLYPGDAIRFGASTRLYILEGPAEFEREAIKLKRKMNEITAAAHSESVYGDDEEVPSKVNEDACGWGMSDDIIAAEQEEKSPVNDHSDLPSIDSFFFSSKYKIPDSLHQLHSQYNAKMHKLQSIQKESQRIMQKENSGAELTEGQRGQLARNQGLMVPLEKDMANKKERIEDGMHTAIHGKARRANKRPKEEEYHDGDVDDFYDRTASSSKKQRNENNVESETSLIQKWKSFLHGHAEQQRVVSRALQRCTALQKQIDNSEEDDEDAFFLQNDLALANDNLSKATKSMEETEKELDDVEYLLKIVNPKLVWDRREGLIDTNIEKREEAVSEGSAAEQSLTQKKNVVDDLGSDSIMMPPPPPSIAASSTMPPPPPMTVAPPSKPTSPEQRQILAPTRPPTSPDDGKSGDKLSMPPPTNSGGATTTKPQKKKKQMGPMRPPVNVQGTLAALKQAVSQSTPAPDSGSSSSQPNGNDAHSQKKTAVVSDPFGSRKDEWKAPVGQDGSGRTALHEKFKGRY
mmetsp:Transcript_19864/g.35930  ORF Transcript_19864/g.35930 Transcript_19864/m.35930 type:complete len:639 (-) Transcript_19864:3-1919(-)